jgi:hypothetical protein
MENLNNEIATLTASKTAEGRTLRIPEGQKALRLGYKPIKMEGLRERFACDKVQASLDLEACREIIKSKGHNPETSVITTFQFWRNVGAASVRYDRYKEFRPFFLGRKRRIKISSEWEHVDRPSKVCTVRVEPVDKYITDKIPDRCLESMQKAMETGMKWESFYVAYPIIEERPMKDPIILSLMSGNVTLDLDNALFLEIDMWE